jgi:uncharacterized protein with von Willebrand factor type A (vWA) domain
VASKLAENVVHFTRLLRGAGLKLGPASGLDALAAAAAVDVLEREELYWALRAVLVKRRRMGRSSTRRSSFSGATRRGRAPGPLFATRLTDATRLLRRRDPDEALARCGRAVADWAGGTRLRACLHDFHRA